jgi:hypothetical protein
MITHTFPSPVELRMIERASAHVVAESLLPERARFRDGVTDLDVARIIRALEAGHMVVQPRGLNFRWVAPQVGMEGLKLNRVVREMLRTGLATNKEGKLVPAMVHLAPAGAWAPRCPARPLRVRTLDHPAMVDCLRCLDRL